MIQIYVVIMILSFFASWGISYFIRPWLLKQYPDIPNIRSSHLKVTARGGGIVFLITLIFSCIINIVIGDFSTLNLIPLVCIPLAIVGLVDDKFNLSSWIKYSSQLITAIVLLSLSKLPIAHGSIVIVIFYYLLCLISITAVINFINFMDGIDGIVASNLSVSFLSISLFLQNPITLLILVGSLLGFLKLNWSPAKVFMGDVGSTFLGAILAGTIIQAETWPQAIGFILLTAPLLADAFICVIIRWILKQNIFVPHKLHLYQRLYQGGWTHAKITTIYLLATLIISITYIFIGLSTAIFVLFTELIIAYYIDMKFAYPIQEYKN